MAVSNEFLLGAGGYYRADDNSGPYFVGSDGKAIPLAGEPGGGSGSAPDALKKANNLSDLTDPQAARENLGFPIVAKAYNLMGFADDESGQPVAVKFDLSHWMGAYPANPTTPADVVPCTHMSSNLRINSYKQMTSSATAYAVAIRDNKGRVQVADGVDDADAVTVKQLKAVGGVTVVDAPTITVSDPPDPELLQANFDALIDALKAAGVFK